MAIYGVGLQVLLPQDSFFYAARNWFQELLLKKIGEKWQESVVEHGFMYVFTGRIFPLIPTSLINLAAGVSTVTFKDFFIGDGTWQPYIFLLPITDSLWTAIC
ncbi:VTT domain-containing protein [Peribacillus frigoritolerans]|nr:VTT domain-containing protein [Peribacillus frigoritolerans]